MQVSLTCFTPMNGWDKPLPEYDSPNTLVLLFGEANTESYADVFGEVRDKYPTSVLAGCSTLAGVSDEHILEQGFVACIVRFHKTRVTTASIAVNTLEDSWRAGHYIGNQLNAPDLKGVLLLTDGLNTEGTDLIRGITSCINPQEISIVGGLASDKMQFKTTWVLHNGVPSQNIACGIGFYGEHIVFNHARRDGFKPFGPERIITRVADRKVYEIDQRPALELYAEYLGEHAQNLPGAALNFPLALWTEDKQHYAVRVPITTHEADNSLEFVADVCAGYRTQLMYGNTDNLVDGAEEVSRELARKIPPNTPVLALAITCAARKLIMQDDTEQELEATLGNLPPGSQQVGFYSYGELAPTESNGNCSHHNATMTLSILYERS